MKNKQTFAELSEQNTMFWLLAATFVLVEISDVHERKRFFIICIFHIVHLMIRKNYRCKDDVDLVVEYGAKTIPANLLTYRRK